MAFGALEEILEQCSREGEPFWRVVLKDDINERNVTEEESIRQMEEAVGCHASCSSFI